MAIKTASNPVPYNSVDVLCDRGIVFSLAVVIFSLPFSIALLDSFAALAVSFYLFKKANRLGINWPHQTMGFRAKLRFIWQGFAPADSALNRPIKFFVSVVAVSVWFSQYPGVSLFAFWGKLIKCVFVYFSFVEAMRNDKRMRVFMGVLIFSACLVAVSGIVQHFTGRDFLKGRLIGTENFASSHRISSSFFGANGFGAYLLPLISLAAHLLFVAVSGRRPWLSGTAAAMLGLFLTCLCWTYSRSAWLGYLVVLLLMVIFDRRKWLLSGILFLIFILVFLPSLNHVRNLNLANDNSSGVRAKNENILESIKPNLEDVGSGRLSYWQKAVSIIYSSPVWGTGLNTYAKIVRRDPDPRTWRYAHNSYLQLTAETGLLGLAGFLWILLALFRRGITACRKVTGAWGLAILQGAIAGLAGFLVQCFFDNTFYTVQLSVFMWLFFGLVMASVALYEQ